MNLLDKKVKNLTWEDKQELVSCKYIFWIKEDLLNDDCQMLDDIIKGNGMRQLTEDNKAVIESEFEEIFFSEYQGLSEDVEGFNELSIEELLDITENKGLLEFMDTYADEDNQ